MSESDGRRSRPVGVWTIRLIAVAGLAVTAWAAVTSWSAVVHSHPVYPVMLSLTVVAAALALWHLRRARPAPPRWRRALAVLLAVLSIAWIGAVGWARPSTAVEPALTAMASDQAVAVAESATRIVMTPASGGDGTALFFQPGARVDARAYAAVLRPVAEAGHLVVIAKQPLGVGFLAVGAFGDVRAAHPGVKRWVVGGHSLGGVVAAMNADAEDHATTAAPVVGLLLYASYPAGDISTSLTAQVESVSGSADGLATPQAIASSRADLPAGAHFTVVTGGVHAFFGDYGPQAGDGTPTIGHDAARAQISAATVAFVDRLAA